MATRFRLSSYPSVIDPPRHASWSGGGTNRAVQALDADGAIAAYVVNSYVENTPAPGNFHVVTAITKSLAAQTITGTVKGQISAYESVAAADFMAQMMVRVLDSNGNHKAVVLDLHASALANEFSTVAANKFFPPVPGTALTDYTCADGDFLAFELGYRAFNVTTVSYTGNLTMGANTTAPVDFPEDQTTTGIVYVPWIEISSDLTFIDPTAAVLGFGTPSTVGTEYFYEEPAAVSGAPDVTQSGQLWPRGF